MPHPIGKGRVYRVVDYVKSPDFPALHSPDDWVFLKLDRPLGLHRGRWPTVAGAASGEGAHISGFARFIEASGGVDVEATNAPVLSAEPCPMRDFADHQAGPLPGLARVACIPPVNFGLSGAPLVEFGVGRQARILGIQMGAAIPQGSVERVPLLVRSERFVAAYRLILHGEMLAYLR